MGNLSRGKKVERKKIQAKNIHDNKLSKIRSSRVIRSSFYSLESFFIDMGLKKYLKPNRVEKIHTGVLIFRHFEIKM